MPGKKARLKPLEARKQLLLAESEINRIRLLEEWSGLKGEVHHLASRVRAVGSFASVTAAVIAAFSAWRLSSPEQNGAKSKSARVSALLDSVRTGASLWAALKSCFR